MKKIINSLFRIMPVMSFLFLLTLSDTTKSGAIAGLNLWFFTVLPTLLPFMIITSLLMETGSYKAITYILKYPMKALFKLSPESGYPFLTGYLCGFPMGSKVTADMVRSGRLSIAEGNILLTFCNNVSPPFITGYILSYILNLSGSDHLRLLAVMLISPLITGIMTSRLIPFINRGRAETDPLPFRPAPQTALREQSILDKCIFSSMMNQLKLGGYIIIFSVLCSIAGLFIHNPYTYSAVTCILEITSGLNILKDLPFSFTKVALACTLSSFGGLCTIAQSGSMIKGSGLSLSIYISGKLLNAAVTFFMLTLT